MLLQMLSSLSHLFCMALHAINTGSFPRPLTAEQERVCLIAYREHGDLAARNQLVEHNLRLVAHIVKKYYNAGGEQDDLISIGTIGLIKAVSTFDFRKGTRLATYASRCIENEILMHFRAAKKTAQDVSISEPIDTDKEGNPLTLMDVIAADDTILDDLELKINTDKLYRYMAALEPRERRLLQLRYGMVGEPLTQREVAAKFGISRSYVSRLEKRALEKLRECFEAGGENKNT